MNDFGKYLKEIRKGRMTQRELAKRIGVGYPYISKIENNVEPPPSDDVLIKLAQALEVDVDELFVQANKIPKELKEIIMKQPKVLRLVRSIKENDITDFLLEGFEKLIIEKEKMYWHFFYASSEKILLIDPDTAKIANANAPAVEFYNYPLELLKKMTISDINTLSKEEIFEKMKKARLELTNHFDFKHRLNHGKIVSVQVKSVPIDIGSKTYLHSIIYESINPICR
ncbi:transcriptional regulator, XRE family [Alkaliphilus metalliredigens QYMF]|uniref:Transcriptional regulator, XRE family n=1 Tax=Alkaliphilus metalliredigens (strain QYMF) TaxID=293826 RepID=A6TNI5_ALKMQ|nr:helix-turn-helix transcriptional regulator [Alkaliphilus metalliredigens]ABR47753.1 transcriptional regulator, XRE family [Alkaliphilus metalliredigens QYMF]